MKNYLFQLKSFLLLSLGIVFFYSSEAQRREERHQQNMHGDRGFSTSPGRSRGNNYGANHEITRPVQRPPMVRNNDFRHGNVHPVQPRYSNPGYNAPVAHNGSAPANRGFVHSVRVAPAPRYGFYGNSYRYHPYYHPPVYNAHNPGWRYSYLPPRRAIITSFPFAYQTINYGGFGYRFYNGTFYRPYRSSFIVVAPPLGLFINVLPFGYRRIYVHDNPYYYYNGTYYDDYDDNYRVVAPPLGAVVESLPLGYETIVIDGETYYKVDGVQYKPQVQDNGEIWYEVIKVD